MILVTGATGHLGRGVMEHLLKKTPASQLVAMVRSASKAADLAEKGIDVRVADYDDAASLHAAMRGIERVLLISGTDEAQRIRQHGAVIDAAKHAGVRFIAYTGRAMKDPKASENSLMEGHFRTEELIERSGLPHALFRNALYMDTLPLFLGGAHVFQTGIHLPAGSGRVAYALRSELGEAIAHVMLAGGDTRRRYTLTAGEAWSFDDVARALTRVSGTPVDYHPTDRATFERRMRERGLPEPLVQRHYGFYCDIRDGQLDEVTPELETLLGRRPASLEHGLKVLFPERGAVAMR